MKKCKWSLTPSPSMVRLGLVFFVLLLILFLVPGALLAQGPDNLVKLKSGAQVWETGLDFGGMFDLPPADPSMRWRPAGIPVDMEWVFKLDSYYDGGYGLILHCFTSHCGLEVKSWPSTKNNSQVVYKGVVFLEQIEFTFEQQQRTYSAINRSLEIYRLETNPRILASILKGLTVWERERYIQKAFEVFTTVGDRLDSCKERADFYRQADDLGFADRTADQLRWLAEDFERKNLSCAAIKKESLTLFNLTGYVPRPRSMLVVLGISPTAPAALVVPLPTVTPQTQIVKETVVVNRVVTTTPPPATATMSPTPTGTPTALPLPTPAPTRRPGEKDLGEQVGEAIVILLLIVLSVMFCVLVAVGLYWWFCIRPLERARTEKEELEREFAETKQQVEQAVVEKKFELAKTLLLKLQRLSFDNEQKTRIYHDLRDLVAKEEIDSIE